MDPHFTPALFTFLAELAANTHLIKEQGP